MADAQRVDDLKQEIGSAEYWNATSVGYARIFEGHEAPKPTAGPLAPLVDSLLKGVDTQVPFASATAIADVGCGIGMITDVLIDQYGQKLGSPRFVASDVSSEMVKYTQQLKDIRIASSDPQLARSKELWANVEPIVADAQDLSPLSNGGSFSHIISNLVLMAVPDFDKALREIHNQLAPGGIAAVSSWENFGWLNFLKASKKIRPDILSMDEVMSGDFSDLAKLKTLLQRHDFNDVRTQSVDLAMPFKSAQSWVDMIFTKDNPATAYLYNKLEPHELDPVRDLMIKSIIDEHGPEGGIFTGRALVVTGRK